MAVVSDIEIRLRADIARLQQDMTAVRRTVDQGMNGVTRAANLAKAAMAGVFAGLSIGAFAKEVIQAQREFDKLNGSLITATGSTQNAAMAFSALQKFAATTPYSVAEATEAFIKLRNLGLTPSEKALTSYGNTAAAMGKGLNQLIEAVADAATGEFERLKEFGIKAKQNGDRVSLTFQGVTKTIGNNAKEIQAYLQGIGDINFGGAMEARAATLDGAISNLGDTWDGFLRKIAQNGAGEIATRTVIALGNALNDLGAIIDTVSGSVSKEAGAVKEATVIHQVLTTAFEAIAVVGVNVAYILEQIGKDMGAFAASFVMFTKGEFKMSADIIEMRHKEAQEARKAVDAKSAAILGASKKNREAQAAEAAALKASGKDQLAQYEIQLTAEQKQQKALDDTLDIRNRLNGVNAQAAGDLAKLKAAYDAGAIGLAEYRKYTAQINKETTLASTAYKNGAKAIDMSTEAIKRRSQAQAFANQQSQDELDFLHRTGQMDDASFIAKQADAAVEALNQQKKALEDQRALLQGRYDTEKERAALTTQIEGKDQEIQGRRTKQLQEQFELEQKLYKEAVGNTADLIEAAQAESKSQKDRTRDQQDEIAMLGMTEKQIAEVTAARLRDQAAALDRRAEIGIIEEVNDKLREQAEELRKQADLGLTKQRVQEQQKFWTDIEQTAHDTFVSIADGGKGAFQRLKDSAKNIFFEWLYQMTLKKWVINIGANVDGASAVAGLAGGNSSLTQGGSLLSSVSNLYSSLTGGLTAAGGVGSGFVGSLVGGLNGAGAGAPLASSLGLQIGSTIANTVGPQIAGAISTGISGLATALPWVGGAVAVYSLAKAAFGRGPKQYADNSTLSGSLGSNGFSGTMNTAYTQKGGWFRSDKNGVDKVAVDAMQASGLTSAYDAIKSASTSYAQVLGLNADSIAARTQAVSIALGRDEAANQKAIADFFTGVGDTIASELLPNISSLQAAGETASEALARVSKNFLGLNEAFALIGANGDDAFGAVGAASLEARERLISFAGGLSSLATQTQFFSENFMTEEEQYNIALKSVNEELEALGLSSVKTTDQYRSAVMNMLNTGSLASEEGAKQYASLLALGPKFKSIANYQRDLLNATIENETRAKEAAEAATKKMLEDNESMLQNIYDSSVDALRASVDSQKDVVKKAYDQAMDALEKRVDGLNDTISKTKELSSALKSAIYSIDSPDEASGSRMAAQAQVTAALAIARASGVMPSLDDLKGALATLGKDATDQFSTLADYQRDVARTNNELDQLGGLSDKQLSAVELQLQVLKDTKTQAQVAYEAEVARLDNLVAIATGTNTSIMTLAQALATVNVAKQALASGATPSNPGGSNLTVEQLYRTVLGREGEKAGIEYWKGVFGEVVDSTEYAEFIKGALPELNMRPQVPMVNSPVQTGTMNSSSANVDQQAINERMEKQLIRVAAATEQLASQFNNVSAGGNALLMEKA